MSLRAVPVGRCFAYRHSTQSIRHVRSRSPTLTPHLACLPSKSRWTRYGSTSALAQVPPHPTIEHPITSSSRRTKKLSQRAKKRKASSEEIVSSVKRADEAKMAVYEWAAAIDLSVPIFRLDHAQERSTVHIDIPSLNISVSGEGETSLEAETQALSQFAEAKDRFEKESFLVREMKSSGLNIENAKEFLPLCAAELHFPSYNLKVGIENSWGLPCKGMIGYHQAQLFFNEQPIGESVVFAISSSAEKIARFTAAAYLAHREPSIFSEFLSKQMTKTVEKEARPKVEKEARPTVEKEARPKAEKKARPKVEKEERPKVEKEARPPPSLHINDVILQDMLSACEHVSTGPSKSHTNTTTSLTIRDQSSFQFPRSEAAEEALARRASFQTACYQNHQNVLRRASRVVMPMMQQRLQVLDLIKQNPTSIIVGATGSGKTTQVPQIILDAAIEKGHSRGVNIICAQPRRIAATSVARRVAQERGEDLKDSVGYHVRFDARLPKPDGSITYCTTGILLKQLQHHPDSILENTSHIILDEVHERNIDIDFVMVTLKTLMAARRSAGKSCPRLVIMSATMDMRLFETYFGQLDDKGFISPCPSLSVPGRTYPVKHLYLADIMMDIKKTYPEPTVEALLQNKVCKEYLDAELLIGNRNPATPETLAPEPGPVLEADHTISPINLIAMVVAHIARTTNDGAILVFLPGLADIKQMERVLVNQAPLGVHFNNPSRFKLYKLHSSLRNDGVHEQVFHTVPNGCRKIILATNIAETSITIPEVQYVVDSGKVREKRYDQQTQISQLPSTWISKSSSRQRAGRAGRVSNGFYYGVFSKARLESFSDTTKAEIHRSDLQEICLSAKVQLPETSIEDFLAGAIEPPARDVVRASVETLKDLGALTPKEDITTLGGLLSSLPMHPSLGKMAILGIIFRCFDPILIQCASADNDLFLRPIGQEKAADRMWRGFGTERKTDSEILLAAFREARRLHARYINNPDRLGKLLRSKFISPQSYFTISMLMEQVEEKLIEANLIPSCLPSSRHNLQYGPPSLNENADNVSLLKALAVTHGRLAHRTSRSHFKTREMDAMVHTSSVNRLRKLKPKDEDYLPQLALLSYNSLFKQDKTAWMKDTALVTPLMVALFGPNPNFSEDGKISIGNWLNIAIDPESQNELHMLRLTLDSMMSDVFEHLADRKFLTNEKGRDAFTTALADILRRDENIVMGHRKVKLSNPESELRPTHQEIEELPPLRLPALLRNIPNFRTKTVPGGGHEESRDRSALAM